MENIYYDLDEDFIRDDAAIELDKLVVLLEDNPGIKKIELMSHTDSRNTADYNQDLSKRRAASAVDYIISKGIGEERISAKGYGESEPFTLPVSRFGIPAGTLLTDENINKLPENIREQAHQLNRRTEFRILEYEQIEEEDEIVDEDFAEGEGTSSETAAATEEKKKKEDRTLKIEKKVESDEDLENRIDWDN